MIPLKPLIFIFLFSIPGIPKLGYASAENLITGHWLDEQGDGIIAISEKSGAYIGTIVGGNGKQSNDIHNPDPKLRNRPLKGVQILGDLKQEGENSWQDGWIYDPKNGNTYQCNITLENGNTLEIRVYKNHPIFGKTVIWKKTQPEEQNE